MHTTKENKIIKFFEKEFHYNCTSMVEELLKNPKYHDDLFEVTFIGVSHESGDVEIYKNDQYWIVSDWLAKKLDDKSEAIINFLGLNIWGRKLRDRPQNIFLDIVFYEIYSEIQLERKILKKNEKRIKKKEDERYFNKEDERYCNLVNG